MQQKTKWRIEKEEGRKEELKDIFLVVLGIVLFLLTAKFNN